MLAYGMDLAVPLQISGERILQFYFHKLTCWFAEFAVPLVQVNIPVHGFRGCLYTSEHISIQMLQFLWCKSTYRNLWFPYIS